MTELAISSDSGSVGRGGQTSNSLDSLFNRILDGESPFSNDGDFERVLVGELKRSSETSAIGIRHAHSDVPAAPPWQPTATWAAFDVANGKDQIAAHRVGGSDVFEPAAGSIYAQLHPQEVVFDADVFGTLNAGVHDQVDRPFDVSDVDDVEAPWTAIADNSIVDGLFAGLESHETAFDLKTDHVFFNGDGRPILLSSAMAEMDVAPATEGNQLILPNGSVFNYDSQGAFTGG